MPRERLPYEGSKLSPEQSKVQIEKLLKDTGCKDYQWTTIGGQSILKFILPVKAKGVEKLLAFKFIPPTIPKTVRQYDTKQYKYVKVALNDERTAFRVLYWVLKNKLLAIRVGLVSAEDELMSHILVSLPDGREMTLGEQLQEALPKLGGVQNFAILPPPEPKKDDKRDEEKVVNAEYETR
jgi:hypothetical protein